MFIAANVERVFLKKKHDQEAEHYKISTVAKLSDFLEHFLERYTKCVPDAY